MTVSYYQLDPQQIIEDISQHGDIRTVSIREVPLLVYPHVYPSDQFRSSLFILHYLERIVKDHRICDMGCGMGVIGQFTLRFGAKNIVQADINPYAVENARANRALYEFSEEKMQIYQSDCFDEIPAQKFDTIVFNIPFHTEPFEFADPLEKAFHDPGFVTLKKFLAQAVSFCHDDSSILVVFSNKGDIDGLELIFDESPFEWQLASITNTDQQYDTRI